MGAYFATLPPTCGALLIAGLVALALGMVMVWKRGEARSDGDD